MAIAQVSCQRDSKAHVQYSNELIGLIIVMLKLLESCVNSQSVKVL